MAVKAPAPRRKAVAKPPARPGAPALATSAAAAAAATTSPSAKPNRSFGDFIRGIPQFATDVRAETRKISWPSWKETWITSTMVGVMVAVTAVFFLLVDGALSFLLQQFLKLAG